MEREQIVRAKKPAQFALLTLTALSLGLGASMAIPPVPEPVPVKGAEAQKQERIEINAPAAAKTPGAHPNQTGKLDPADIKVPASVKQGEVLKVRVMDTTYFVRNSTPSSGWASLAGKKVPFFQQEDDTFLALVPVSVFEKPGAHTLTIHDPNGSTVFTTNVEIQDGKYRRQNISVSSSTAGLKPEAGELETVQKLKETLTPIKLWADPFVSPTIDCQNSPFGVKRYHNGKATGDYHKGVDLRSPSGRPIRATNAGKVQIARKYRLHGGTVGIDHGQGVSSIYIHMSSISVKPGQVVKKGDVVGAVGATGFATGPHLHWGLFVNGLPVNPNQFIKGVPTCG